MVLSSWRALAILAMWWWRRHRRRRACCCMCGAPRARSHAAPTAYDCAAMHQELAEADVVFGARLKRARDDAGLTTVQLAEQLFLTRESVDRYMRGQRRPSAELVTRWEDLCGLAPGTLIEPFRRLPPRRASPGQQLSDQAPASTVERPEAQRVSRTPRRRRTAVVIGVVVATIAAVGGLIGALGHSGSTSASDCNRVISSSPSHGPPYCVNGTCVDGSCVLLERRSPNTKDPPVGRRREGQTIPITCQIKGERVVDQFGASSDVWNRLDNGHYVLDYYTTTPGTHGFSVGIPRCA